MYICIYVYTYIYIHIYVYMYTRVGPHISMCGISSLDFQCLDFCCFDATFVYWIRFRFRLLQSFPAGGERI